MGTGVSASWDGPVLRLAKAIAVAEGSDPAWNNPGDLTYALDLPTCGVANSEGVLKFVKLADGWFVLYHQCYLMLGGRSKIYKLTDTIAEVGLKYSGGDPNWGKNVAAYLGVPETATLQDLADA